MVHYTSVTADIAAATLTCLSNLSQKIHTCGEISKISRKSGFIHVPVQISFPWSHPNKSQGNIDFPFPPNEMVALEILISRSYQNDSDENVCFPVVFPSRAVQFHENIDLSNPEHTETIHKNMIPLGFFPRCPACTGPPSGNSTYVFMHLSTVGMASDRCRVFGALCIYLPVFSNFVFCIRTY